MQELIFLSSNVFFLGTQDSLGFVSNFSGNSGPYLCCVPNGGPLELNRVRADGGESANGARRSIAVDVTFGRCLGFKNWNHHKCEVLLRSQSGAVLQNDGRSRALGVGEAAVQVYYVISVDGLDVLPNTLFRLGSQI
ncbi:hypothetical protein MJO28_002850 [Puccinia striiformis f. sp. tritici]|uniref:Uncharacterized protein n=1 Tax=Puccinia striiformis f. sp. tritici TaxID=168172 RepID=A0ACC0ERI2_9BASI|nr:hypothetical protein MJO28_002850 [Puccinia striiformis f. sp. tritici]